MSEDEFGYPSDMDESFGATSGGASEDEVNWFEADATGEESIWQTIVSHDKPFQCMRPEEIISKQTEAMEAVNNILPGFPLACARVLLQKHNWDTMRLLSELTERPQQVCEAAGVIYPAPAASSCSGSPDSGNCLICFEDTDLYALPCGHAFCRACWAQYLAIEVKERRPAIVCCAPDCCMAMDESTVLELVPEEQRGAYQETLMNSFVEHNMRCSWCPAPECNRAILLLDVLCEGNEVVTCDCGHGFCFRCMGLDHRPCSCSVLREWRTLHQGESASLDEGYVAAHSRPCPKCRSPIEKNFGCNHMTCKCGYHFCWTCMKKFGDGAMGGSDGYRSHKCNDVYEEDASVKGKRAELDRYRHYSERYDAHALSAKLEVKMLREQEELLGVLKNEGFLGNDFSPAIRQILQNRNTLRCSYAFGYFRAARAPAVNKGIFENLQLDLERHTELLSRLTSDFSTYVMGDGEHDEIDERRQALVNQTRISAKVLSALLDASSSWNQAEAEEESAPEPVTIRLLDDDGDGDNGDDVEMMAPRRKKRMASSGKWKERTAPAGGTGKSAAARALEMLQEAETPDPKPKKKKRKIFSMLQNRS